MKKIGLCSLMAVTLFCSCKKTWEAPMMKKATIVGPDLTLTACSGGAILYVGDSTITPLIDAIAFRLTSVPASSGIDIENGPFPIDVELTFTIDSSRCIGWNYIITDDIRRR